MLTPLAEANRFNRAVAFFAAAFFLALRLAFGAGRVASQE
jgi:hypothetical protein